MTEMKNTLFRFATMRAPELIDDASKALHFVQHPSPKTTGHFKTMMDTGNESHASQLAKWKTLATAFTAMADVADAKTYVGTAFAHYTNWLAKNATSISLNNGELTNAPTAAPLTQAQKIVLWDNLFYQLATGKNNYLRDFCMEALIASHFIENSGSENAHLNALSRVIIPAEFFGSSELPETQPAQLSPQVAGQLKTQLNVFYARKRVEECNLLLAELAAAEAKHEKANKAAYATARKDYDTQVEALIRQQSTSTPTGPEDSTGGSLNIPPFEFTPAPEILDDNLEPKLSYLTRSLAEELLLTSGTVSTFNEAKTVVKAEAEKQTAVLLRNSTPVKKSVALQGVVVPVEEEMELPDSLYAFAANAMPIWGGHFSIALAVNTGYANASAVQAQYSLTFNSGEQSATNYSGYAQGNVLVLQLFPNNIYLTNAQPPLRLHGSITLSNGITLLFDTNLVWGQITNGVMEVEGAGANPVDEDFVPSGFGIKRLGIADYRVVEQTTCCYVPGEVSHIENVMAREYKERSSRRLRRSEDTTTVERQTEKEDLTDTTTTDRYEMQQQTSEVINKDTQSSFNSNAGFSAFGANVTIGSNFAYNTSQQQSNSQALTYAKDVTQRAQERVVQKVREERVLKIIDEFEENQKHGFDNRKGNKHISGVYRWVDKIYKNQIFNYGKRLMYEFLVPQPSVFHNEAMKGIVSSGNATVLEKPADPRTQGLENWQKVNESNAAQWAALYNAEVENVADEFLAVNNAFGMSAADAAGKNESGAKSFKMDLPDGYEATQAKISASFQYQPDREEWSQAHIRVGDGLISLYNVANRSETVYFSAPIRKELGVAVQVRDLGGLGISVVANCRRTPESFKAWQVSCFNTIITAYEKKLSDYNDALAAVKQDPENKNTNPQFYRQIENTVLRKNCIGYLAGHANMGKNGYTGSGVSGLHPVQTASTDRYGALAKFMEQAFEWDLMSYTFYPFYWADKGKWQGLYQADVSDPLFRSFLQAGMARVVATVRPGFEEAVMYYMQTGRIWNGGQTPVPGDTMYLSIVEELKKPTYYVEETWETRVPTSLTAIQAGSLGLQTQGLPCCHANESTGFVQLNDVMEGDDDDDNGNGGNIPVLPGANPAAG
jgi:hypothetical protein